MSLHMMGPCTFTPLLMQMQSTMPASSIHPIAVIKALCTGLNASKATSEDPGGLEPVICPSCGA